MGRRPKVDRTQLVERGRQWAQTHVGMWTDVQLPVLNDTGGRFSSRRLCARRIRVLEVYKDFALVEIQAKGRGSWRESLEFELLGAQVRVDEEPVSPRSPGAGACGCVTATGGVR